VLQSRFYSSTPHDKGTLFQLKEVINRTSFGKQVKHNMKAAEDFLDVVLCAHVLTAAEHVQQSESAYLDCKAVANLIVENFVKISLPQLEENATSGGSDRGSTSTRLDETAGDSVYTYATDFLTMALIWYGFHDAIKMGDGDRITTYWKFMAPIFNQTGHCNYAKEGFLMLAQCTSFSPRKSAELKWSRTINTHGRRGANVLVDLHMEHLNRRLKGMMRGLGSNITPQSIQRASKALGVIESVCTNFENTTNIAATKDYHSMPSFERDLQKLKEQLVAQDIFSVQQRRRHKGYKNHKQLLNHIDWEKYKKWVEHHISNYDIY